MTAREGFRTFDHTGDLGLEVWAETRERLHGLAAEALAAQVVEPRGGPAEVSIPLAVDGDDAEDLFVHWLNTVLLRGELDHAVWTHADVRFDGANAIAATLAGERLDRDRHVRLREVKAVCFHDLLLHLDPGGCRCRVILDI